MATSKQQADDDEAFAAEFNADDKPAKQQSDDTEFDMGKGDGTETAGTAAADTGKTESADTAATSAGATDATAPADDLSAKEKALQDREEKLRAKEAELDQRAAAAANSATNETQTSTVMDDDKGDKGETQSARAALTEDFGPEFVGQLEAFIKEVCSGAVSGEIGTLAGTVQSVIDSLTAERNQRHFQTIAEAHEDFTEIVESQAFQDWLDGQPADEKADLQRVIESGSAKEIIAMLTKFKESNKAEGNDDALDAAEGVRGSGLRLPTEPKDSQDYANAWNEA